MIARGQERFDQAGRHLEESLAIAERLKDEPSQAAALNNLALVYQDCGRIEAAIRLTGRALDVCARLGDRHRQAALHTTWLTCSILPANQTGPWSISRKPL